MKIGIVGSREFPQIKLVQWFIDDLPKGVTIISGGAKGVDGAAADHARERGLEVIECLPDLEGCIERYQYTERYYARNQRIVDGCDMVVAFTEKDNGGTWDTIKRAIKANKPVKIIRPSAFYPGEAEPEPVEAIEEPTGSVDCNEPNRKGKGPFQIKRVSLGSYALKLKRYMQPEDWARVIVDKADDPEALPQRMIPDFIRFFEANNRFGRIHAITMPPRSFRNIDRPHVMNYVCQAVADHLGCEYVQMYQPWDKTSRGRFAETPDIEIVPGLERWIGKVIYCLDDVSTSNRTLQAAVKALTAMEMHAHGICWVMAH